MKKRKSPKKGKKTTVAQCLLDAQIIYDTNIKMCREEMVRADASARKRKRRKSPKRKSPKRKSPKRKSPKRKSPKRKSPKQKKKTQAQLRKECRAQGLVYDTKTKRCRESKRKRRKSPKRKSPKRKSPKRKKKKSRQGPFESATAFPVGYRLWGNDGKRWEIMSDKNGRKRWKRVSTDTL